MPQPRTPGIQPSQQVHHGRDVPAPAAAREDAATVHLGRNGTQADRATGSDVLDHRPQVLGMTVGVARNRRPERLSAPSSPPQRICAVGVAQPHPAPSRRGRRGDGSPADARLPARLATGRVSRAVERPKGGHADQRVGRDLQREAVSSRLSARPTGRHAARRRQFRIAWRPDWS